MAYQIWTMNPVKPRKGEIKFKGFQVSYINGTEGSADADLRHVQKMIKILDADGSHVLVAKVNGHAVHIGDADFLPRAA